MSQPNFFVDHKKGEVNELKAHLRNPAIDKDPEKKRDVIKRVIAYMTLGIDVSRLFSEMVMATNTKDMVQKKMVYLYLCTYAQSNSELAILAINTLRKDCDNEDPMVRGLALRSICDLRLPNIIEYVQQPIQSGLKDPSPYVRKTAVIGVLKLYYLAPQVVLDSDLVDTVTNMIKDRDPQVVTNAIVVLNEIKAEEGGLPITKPVVHHVLNRLKEFDEWSQSLILEYVARYVPENEDETFDIMNLLEDRLRKSNSAVVLATMKIFLTLTKDMPEVHIQVYQRLKAPLLTLMSAGVYELAYTTLSHIHLLVHRQPDMFADEFKQFFCRYNDASSVKTLKLEILCAVTNERSMPEIVSELSEYVTDVDVNLARRAIQSIGTIAIKVPSGAETIIDQLLRFLDLDMDYVTAETVVVMRDLLRKYPEHHEVAIAAIGKCLKSLDEPNAKAAVLWLIGEYGESIPDAPYILEPLVDEFGDEESSDVKKELLTATVKLFFKRAGEIKPVLGKLMETAVNDFSNADVHDYALLYYRLLRHNIQDAEAVVRCQKQAVTAFAEDARTAEEDRVFAEFNSLSVVYGQPSEKFIVKISAEEEAERIANKEFPDAAAPTAAEADTNHAAEAPVPAPAVAEANLLDMDTFAPAAPSIALAPGPTIEPAIFQQKWGELSQTGSLEVNLPGPPANGAIEGKMAARHINCMASGTVGDHMKFYFYAKDMNGGYFLVETLIVLSANLLNAKFKADNADMCQAFVEYFKQSL